MSLPVVGEYVRMEYLLIDEIEATCWLCDYHVLSYIDNYDMKLKLCDIGKKDNAFIHSIDPDTGRIDLKFRIQKLY